MASRRVPIEGTQPIDDPHYRYKRPALGIKFEGRGNGKKTLIINLADIAKALHRNPAELSRFLTSQGGCGGGFDNGSGVLTLQGHKEEVELEKLIREYTQSFVLCGNCDRPETKYRRRKKVLVQKCDGCGEVTPAGDNIEYEGIVKWILRQEGDNEIRKLKDDDGSGGIGDSKRSKSTSSSLDGSAGKKERKEKKKEKKEKKKKKNKKEGDIDSSGAPDENGSEGLKDDDDDDDASSGGSPKGLDFNKAVESLNDFISGHPPISLVTIELRGDTEIPREQLLLILEATLSESEIKRVIAAKGLPLLKEYKSVINALAESVAARWIIAVVEHAFAVRYPDLPRKLFPLVLHQLYEEDLLDEEDIIAWSEEEERSIDAHEDVSDEQLAALREASEKFVTWLKEAEEEEESEEEDDEDEA